MNKMMIISPQDWGLAVADATSETVIPELGVSPAELDRRIRGTTYEWLSRQFDPQSGAFYGFYGAPDKRFEPPQTVNLIAPWQCLAAYDRYADAGVLDLARRAYEWFYSRFVISHPMSVVAGGVREQLPNGELWIKFAAEFALLSIGLFQRTQDETYLIRARQSASFLIQSGRHSFAPRYNLATDEWLTRGWVSFGRAIEAFLALGELTGEPRWDGYAKSWGEYALSLQQEDGSFYLINDDYFNTDLVADELRGLTMLYELTGRSDYWQAAERFASWLISHQRADGAWPMTIDRDGNVVVSIVGPGDIPNIGIALLRMHRCKQDPRHLEAAARAFRYSLAQQILPGSDQPYAGDPNVQWGFWSWDPYYDYTLSGDQATHHARGMMFAMDYITWWDGTHNR